ncbi:MULTISPECIES: hypothetical protein [Bacillus]|uniref:hypothetical protein n=1 Tax=Bacillus TaxID=1386 RepID=UPI0004E712A9|nr:hypothetical protein [Bacillus stercoris]AUS12189.1 hypothetical protein C0W65_09165 [Bacillus subtilis]AUZ41229.1 hypothetical protein C1T29_24545 [Bacillus sp. MBGLi79]POO82039.1 hypothetical protein C1T30_10215 [Bacillus sp. MBGLi97]KFF54916.1 hypothetical protein CM50_00265 [Bacillus subtilis] [Bacillus stercoris]OIS57211.1 hypothetical protein A4A35_02675 [Bacillus subtilis]
MKVIKMNTPKGSSFHSKVVITGQDVLGFAGNLIVSETFAKSDLVKVFLFRNFTKLVEFFSFLSKRERSVRMSTLKKWLKRELVRKGLPLAKEKLIPILKEKMKKKR